MAEHKDEGLLDVSYKFYSLSSNTEACLGVCVCVLENSLFGGPSYTQLFSKGTHREQEG